MTGLVTVAGIPLWEARSAEQDADMVTLAGRESVVDFRGGTTPALTAAQVQAAHDNIVSLGREKPTVPVVFSDKTQLTGFYKVTRASSQLTKYGSGAVHTATWSMDLERVGGSRDVEVESRVPSIARLDELAGVQTPVFWHAPAPGFTSYWTGTTVPAGTVTRESVDGPVTVYTGTPSGAAPRWTVSAEDFYDGSARLTLDGQRRLGTFTSSLAVWEVHNGLVRLMSGPDGSFTVWAWDSNGWRSPKSFYARVSSANVTSIPEFTVLRNDPEEVAVRLSYPTTPGRTTVDLSVRRGSRFVSGVVKRHAAASLGVRRTVSEATTAVTGGLVATSPDADGNRYVVGSSRTPTTTNTSFGHLVKGSVTAFDFFVGHELGVTDEVQAVAFGGTATGGSFTLTFGAATTGAIAWNATAPTVQSALEALSTVGAGNVLVTGGPAPSAPFTVTFVGALGGTDVAQMTADGALLTGTFPTVTVSTVTQGVPAAVGDRFADLFGQYLGAASGERARIVRR